MTGNADEVINEYGAAIARIAASYERNPALREELLQEILLAIVSALPRLRDADKLKPFIFRIAHNRAVAHVVERMREPVTDATPEAVAEELPTHEQSLIAHQQSDALLMAIRSLTLPYRQVITLVLEDLTYPEIADVLGISTVNVGVRVTRAKQRLKELLDHGR